MIGLSDAPDEFHDESELDEETNRDIQELVDSGIPVPNPVDDPTAPSVNEDLLVKFCHGKLPDEQSGRVLWLIYNVRSWNDGYKNVVTRLYSHRGN